MSDFIKATEMPYYREILDDLCNLSEGLTKWEVDFIEKLSDWEGCFTEPQAETLQKVYDRRI